MSAAAAAGERGGGLWLLVSKSCIVFCQRGRMMVEMKIYTVCSKGHKWGGNQQGQQEGKRAEQKGRGSSGAGKGVQRFVAGSVRRKQSGKLSRAGLRPQQQRACWGAPRAQARRAEGAGVTAPAGLHVSCTRSS